MINLIILRPVVENPESEDEPLMESSSGTDGVDARIENFLRDWHHSPDLLFSIHPVDGSFLIWYLPFIHIMFSVFTS